MASEEVLEQLCEHCGPGYCTAREIMRYAHQNSNLCAHTTEDHSHCPNLSYVAKRFSDRFLFQFKCIEELKWIKSQELGKEITWDEAGLMWVDEGYATVFADVWNSGERNIYFFFRAGTVPERKKYSHKIELEDVAVGDMAEAIA